MAFIALLWRLARSRWARRMLFWLVLRLLRWFGWRRAAKLAFRGRRHWRILAVGAWRAAVRLLRLGRLTFILLGWLGPRAWRVLRPSTRHTLQRSTVVPTHRRLRAGDEQSALRLPPTLRVPRTLRVPPTVRADWAPRLARRRDEVRRSLLAAVGVDPNWRPARKPRAGEARAIAGEARAVGHRNRPELGDRISPLAALPHSR